MRSQVRRVNSCSVLRSRPSDDDGAHARLGVEPPERVAKLLIDLKRQRIETFGPVEGDGRDRGLGVEIIQK